MRLQPPDQLSTVLIWIAAIFIATRQGVESWPAASRALPFVLDWGWISFAPLVLLTIAALRQFDGKPRAGATPSDAGGKKFADAVFAHSAPVAVPEPFAPPAPEPGERDYVPAAIAKRFLAAVQERKTELQRDAILRQHLGKWIRLQGVLVTSSGASGGSTAVMLSPTAADDGHRFWVYFKPKWTAHVVELQPGDSIICDALINQSYDHLRLEDADLVSL